MCLNYFGRNFSLSPLREGHNMKSFTRFILLIGILSIPMELLAQEILWAKKTTEPPWSYSRGFLTDKWGNVYSIASYSGNLSNPSEIFGTILTKYDKEGNQIFQKKWEKPFYIQDIKYDGELKFYFTGYFTANTVVDEFSLTCNGSSDAFIGVFNPDGKIQWVKSVGGSLDDQAFGLTLNKSDGNLLITGFSESPSQQIFFSSYDKSGNLNSNKNIDSFNAEFGENSGREITTDLSGNIYLLFDRKGNHPLDSVNDIAGRYLAKFDSQRNLIWSKYINGPSCYYGWEGKKLKLNEKGELLLLKYCAAKYGGTGNLLKHNSRSGEQISSYGNKCQLGYNDLFMDKASSYLLAGNEGAAICPCETNDPGYQVVKKFNENGSTSWERRLSNLTIISTARDNEGSIYIQGYFSADTVMIGNMLLSKDSKTYFAGFIAKIKDKDIPEPDTTDNKPPTTSIAERNSMFKLYPNPGSRDFVFESNQSSDGSIKIYNLTGKEVKLIRFKNSLKIKFNLENEAEGIYICKVEDIKGRIILTEKLVLVK
jgi:hypothetical protein